MLNIDTTKEIDFGYICKYCHNTYFTVKEKDIAHIGLYCSKCGRWLKWAGQSDKYRIK